MTSYVHWLKASQDDPISVAHLRALDEGAETILRYNKAAVFSQAFAVSGARPANGPGDGPVCYWPGECENYKVVLCYYVTGAPSETTFTVEIPTTNGTVTATASETPSTSGVQYFDFDVSPDVLDKWTFTGYGRFTFSCDKPWFLQYLGIYAWFDEYESAIPFQGEIADSLHFKNIINKIIKAYRAPHMMANWMGSYQITRDAIAADSAFKLMFAYDTQDKTLNSSACVFTADIVASLPNDGPTSTHFGYVAHQDSGNSVSGAVLAANVSGLATMFRGSISGTSYKTTSGWSHIHVDMASDDSPRPYIRGMSLIAEQNDYQSDRYDDADYNTLVRLSNYDSGDTVTTTMFNAAARALFNIGFHMAGPPSMACAAGGCPNCNFASYTVAVRYPLMIRNHWLMGKRDRDYLKFTFTQVLTNGNNTRTGYTRFTTVTSGHTATATPYTIVANDTTHVIEELEIQKDDKDADFLWLEMELYQSSIVPPGLLTWCHFNTPLTASYTP